MEKTAALVDEAARSLRGAKDDYDAISKEITETYEVVAPELLKQIGELRSMRMSIVTELRESLGAMRDARKFFLESDYQVEVDRLEILVRLCREIQQLKQDGTFDAVCDSALKLAVAK